MSESRKDVLLKALQGYRTRFPGVPLTVFEIDKATPETMRRRPGMSIQYNLQHDLTHQKLVDRSATYAHNDPNAADPKVNAFIKRLIPFLNGISAEKKGSGGKGSGKKT